LRSWIKEKSRGEEKNHITKEGRDTSIYQKAEEKDPEGQSRDHEGKRTSSRRRNDNLYGKQGQREDRNINREKRAATKKTPRVKRDDSEEKGGGKNLWNKTRQGGI